MSFCLIERLFRSGGELLDRDYFIPLLASLLVLVASWPAPEVACTCRSVLLGTWAATCCEIEMRRCKCVPSYGLA